VNFHDGEFGPEYFEDYAVFFVVDKRKNLRAALAEPIMAYTVDSSRRITH